MKRLLTTAWLGSLIDTIATVYLSSIGYIEANPIMAILLECPPVFVTVKMVVMTGLLVYLWQKRTDKHAKAMATLAASVYGLIAVYYGLWLLRK